MQIIYIFYWLLGLCKYKHIWGDWTNTVLGRTLSGGKEVRFCEACHKPEERK